MKVGPRFSSLLVRRSNNPEALATITRGKMISEMTAWDRKVTPSDLHHIGFGEGLLILGTALPAALSG